MPKITFFGPSLWGTVKSVVKYVGGLLASRRVFCWLPFVFFVPVDIQKAYIREAGTLNPYVKQGDTSGMRMFSFSIIIPVKSFEQTLNFKSLQVLYRQKSGGGGTCFKFSSNNYVLKYNR